MGTWASFRPNQATETVFSTSRNYECDICLIVEMRIKSHAGPRCPLKVVYLARTIGTKNYWFCWPETHITRCTITR